MPFGSLWLPGVASAVAVWLVSAILHMALKYHRADYRPLVDEDAVAAALRKAAPAPGLYMIPYCTDGSQSKDPAMQKKFTDGPLAMIAVGRPGVPNMGKYLALWFLSCLLTSFVVAYVARHTLTFTTDGILVLRITSAVAFAAYGLGYLQDSIWKAIPWSNTIRGMIDALIYALVTGLVFRWLWPSA